MTGKVLVLDFASAKNAKAVPSEKKKQKNSVTRIITNHDIFQDVLDIVLDEWRNAASANKLNTYVRSKIPNFAQGGENADHLNDLNVIANAEQKLKMKVSIFCPGTTTLGNPGWVVAFYRGKEVYSAPSNVSESYARALNILLFLKFEYQLKKLNRN